MAGGEAVGRGFCGVLGGAAGGCLEEEAPGFCCEGGFVVPSCLGGLCAPLPGCWGPCAPGGGIVVKGAPCIMMVTAGLEVVVTAQGSNTGLGTVVAGLHNFFGPTPVSGFSK